MGGSRVMLGAEVPVMSCVYSDGQPNLLGAWHGLARFSRLREPGTGLPPGSR